MLFGLIKQGIDTVGGVFKQRAEIKKIKNEGALRIEQAKIDYKVAKLNAQSALKQNQLANDTNYDMQVLKNRREPYMDELIIMGFISIMILTFIPATQNYMAVGWQALSTAPWWFEFGIVGILVSTLGLKDVLRMFMGVTKKKIGGSK